MGIACRQAGQHQRTGKWVQAPHHNAGGGCRELSGGSGELGEAHSLNGSSVVLAKATNRRNGRRQLEQRGVSCQRVGFENCWGVMKRNYDRATHCLSFIICVLLIDFSTSPATERDVSPQFEIGCLRKMHPFSNTVSVLGKVGKRGFIDGGGGIDTFSMPPGTHIVFNGRRHGSLEVINTRNGRFDTIAVLEGFIRTTELNEVEMVSDWYDTIILDPHLEWRAQPDVAFLGLVFEAVDQDGVELRIRTPIDANVIGPKSDLLLTVDGLSDGRPGHALLGNLHKSDPEAEGEDRVKLTWLGPGTITPDIAQGWNSSRILIDAANGEDNVLLLDLRKLPDEERIELSIEADAFDLLRFVQPACWLDETVPAPEGVVLATHPAAPVQVRLTVPSSLTKQSAYPDWTVILSQEQRFFHLSADATKPVDAINLRNRVPDVLMVRNDVRLRPGHWVELVGDPGLDEIWLEGTSGWELEFADNGVVASTSIGRDRPLRLAFGAGLKIRKLPPPAFLSDPRLKEVEFYPGIADEPSAATGLLVSRGGYVRFSEKQLRDKLSIDFTNGIANVFELRPDLFLGRGLGVSLFGDPGLDEILPIGMPPAERNANGNWMWQVKTPNGTRRIIAEGFDLRLGAESYQSKPK